jgi:hypothetical protein
MSVCCVCCQVEVSVSGRSLVQRSPTDCDVSIVCDLETYRMRRPWPAVGCCARGGGEEERGGGGEEEEED